MEDFLPVAERIVQPHANMLLLQAPQEHFKGYSWYEVEPNPVYGITKTCRLLSQILASLRKQGIPESQCFMIGFSQGGKLLWEFGPRYPIPLAGYIILNSQCADVIQIQADMIPEIVSQGNWLITAGSQDRIVSPDIIYRQCEQLYEAGFNLSFIEFNKGHEFDYNKEIPYIDWWLREKMKGN